MKRIKEERRERRGARAGGLAAALVVLLAAAWLMSWRGESAGAAGEKKSLTRTEDPVVVLPKSLPTMSGAQIKMLALFVMTGGKFSPLPFQVDERGADGYFVYTKGPEAKPANGNGKYDGNDELVFMAWDLGDQAPAGAALPCPAVKAVEIEIKDPLAGGKGWAYLAECKATPPLSKTDYVRQDADAQRDWVRTDRYHFAEQKGESYFDRLALRGADGKVGASLIDRLKGRGHITAIGNMVSIDTPESDVHGRLMAWIDGPVRVVHFMTGYLKFSIIKLNIGGHSENLFYSNFFVTPITADTPISPSSVLSSFTLRYTIDWLKDFEGAKYYDPVNTKGVVLDGKMSPEEKALDYKTGHEWYALTGPKGNLMVRMILPDKWRKIIPLKLYYVDDVNAKDPPESDPGQRCPGFMLDSMVNMPPGTYKYFLYYMVPLQAPPGSVPALLNIQDKPLQASAKAYP